MSPVVIMVLSWSEPAPTRVWESRGLRINVVKQYGESSQSPFFLRHPPSRVRTKEGTTDVG